MKICLKSSDLILQNLFVIEQASGIVRTNGKLDRDSTSVVTITMNVVDVSASPRQTGTGKIEICISSFIWFTICIIYALS